MASDEFREPVDESEIPSDEQMLEWFPKLFQAIDEDLAAMSSEDIDPREPVCSFCGAEVIPLREDGADDLKRLVCCRLIPFCGAQYLPDGFYLGGVAR